jgi:FAD/FMN-containing dehydrogenase
MTPHVSELARIQSEDVRGLIHGRVITPDDVDYDEARAITLGGVDARPALIVRVADVDDVRTVIALARESGMELAVRSGGHSGAAHSTVDGGIVLDVRDLDGLEIDEADRTAWAGSGLTAGAYTEAAAELSLATGFGDTGSVGLGGIVTGGGMGYLGRLHGLTIDSLLAAEIVTADGSLHVVDEDHEPDLFWAIRGGGGNLGVVTRFKLQLHPLPGIVGGLLLLPATTDTIAGFVKAADAAPEALSTIANVMPCPPMPFVPEDHHGEVVILALMCWAGPSEQAEAVLAPFRALATPIADMLAPMPYTGMYQPEDPDYHPLAISRMLFMDTFDRAEAQVVVDHLDASDAAMRVAQIRVLGGAISRVASDATAYAHRDRKILVNVASFYTGDDDKSRREQWVIDFATALRQAPGAYVGFVADEGPERVHEAYPGATWDRLAEIKRRYDPGNLFRRNQNVPPADSGR